MAKKYLTFTVPLFFTNLLMLQHKTHKVGTVLEGKMHFLGTRQNTAMQNISHSNMQHSNFCTLHWLGYIDWLLFTDRPAPQVGNPPPTGSSRERSHRRCSFLSRVRSRCCPTWLGGTCSVRCTYSGITVLWSAVCLWNCWMRQYIRRAMSKQS